MFGTCEDIDGKGTKCPRKARCTDLCDPAEAKVGQDNVNYRKSGVYLQNKRTPPGSENEWLDYIAFSVGTDMPEPRVDMSTFEELDHLKLTSMQHQTLISYFVDGLAMKDIGKVDGVSRQAIHRRMRRAGGSIKVALARRMMWNDKVRHILNDLSDKEQSAAFFYYHELMNYKEITDAMGIKEHMIKKLIKHVTEIALGG